MKSIKLNIADPCHEDWKKMTPNEQGRFCDSCAKPVMDFSKSTDLEIVQFLETHKGQKTCGRFKATQLDRPIYRPYAEPSYSNFSLRTALLGATLTSLLSLESCKEPVKMGEVAATNVTEQSSCSMRSNESEMVLGGVEIETYNHSDEHLMSGIVVDAVGGKIEKAKLTLFSATGVEIGKTTTKIDGSFRLELNWEKKPSYVQVSSDEYLTVTIRLNRTEVLQEMKIVLKAEMMIRGDIDVREE